MCQYQTSRGHRRRGPVSEKMKFYRHLRSFLIFNLVMAMLTLMGSGVFGMWKASLIWGIFVGAHYIKAFGWPGANGWFGEDWEAWMEERERRAYEGPEPLEQEPRRPRWKDRDLV